MLRSGSLSPFVSVYEALALATTVYGQWKEEDLDHKPTSAGTGLSFQDLKDTAHHKAQRNG